MISHDGSNMGVAIILGLFVVVSMVLVLYWAATAPSHIENNPDKK